MSSLSNKVFDLKALHPQEHKHSFLASARAELQFIPKDYLDFFGWLSSFQEGAKPQLLEVDILSFAGDHGIRKEFSSERFRTGDFLLEAIQKPNQFEPLNPGIQVQHYFVDLGVDFQFESNLSYWLNHSNRLINSKVKRGTESFSLYPAMTDTELSAAFYNGRKLIDRAHYQDRDLVILHSLGDGQIYSIYALAWALSISNAKYWEQQFPERLGAEIVNEIQKGAKRHPISHDPFTNLCFYGGLETIALCGAMLRCAEKGIPFIAADPMSLLAWQYAIKICPGLEKYGYAVGMYTEPALCEGMLTIYEGMSFSPDAREWGPFLWKLQQMIRIYNS